MGTGTGRGFTLAARIAAMEARRVKREAALPLDTPGVFVVRLTDGGRPFGWEIRRFGAVVIERCGGGYASVDAALSAGTHALSRMGVPA